MSAFSLNRFAAVFFKEFVQMRRDRLTFAIMIAVPIMQLTLFGYAINTDPRHMAAVVVLRDTGPFERSMLASLKASTFFDIIDEVTDAEKADHMMRAGRATFIIEIPAGFESRVVAGQRPQILLAADATDPVASGGAVGAAAQIAQTAFDPLFTGALQSLAPPALPYDFIVPSSSSAATTPPARRRSTSFPAFSASSSP